MQFDPSKWYLGSLEVFSALLPGAITVYVLRSTAIASDLIERTNWPDATSEWVLFLIASLVIGYLAHPPAHILNKLYDRTYRQWRRQGGDPLLRYAQKEAAPFVGPKDSVYAWAKSEVEAASPVQARKIDLMEGISKMFRTLALVAMILAIVGLFMRAWLWAGLLTIVGLLSFFVFAQRRFGATKEVYQSLKRIRSQSEISVAPASTSEIE